MNIKNTHVAAFMAVTAMSFGLAANAQPGPGRGGMGPADGGCAMAGGPMMGDPGARADQQLARFKGQLKITPQQEPLWQAFAEKLKASTEMRMKAMHGMQQPPATAPERMDRMLQHMKDHTAAMEGVSDSFKRLYDALTPEQKAIADKFQPFQHHMGPKRGGPRSGMGPQGSGGAPGAPGQAGGPAPR